MACPVDLCGMPTPHFPRFAQAWKDLGRASMVRNWASVIFSLPGPPLHQPAPLPSGARDQERGQRDGWSVCGGVGLTTHELRNSRFVKRNGAIGYNCGQIQFFLALLFTAWYTGCGWEEGGVTMRGRTILSAACLVAVVGTSASAQSFGFEFTGENGSRRQQYFNPLRPVLTVELWALSEIR